jgi:cytidine diphosphoramidate kinase
MVIWFIGLSGSGKTTLGIKLTEELRKKYDNVVFLDGDILRDVWGDDTDHSIKGREKNAKRISNLCKVLDKQGLFVVASVLSIFPDWQRWNRENFSEYFEIFLDVPMKVLLERDTKDLYKKAKKGELKNVVGLDIPFPKPYKPDLILSDWPSNESPDETLLKILKNISHI